LNECEFCGKAIVPLIGLTIKGPMVCGICWAKWKDRVHELIMIGVEAIKAGEEEDASNSFVSEGER
jgi:hypothetical protein